MKSFTLWVKQDCGKRRLLTSFVSYTQEPDKHLKRHKHAVTPLHIHPRKIIVFVQDSLISFQEHSMCLVIKM